MSERKVLNKYYPPDFDPSKIPRMKQAKDGKFGIRLMAPFNMRCNTCGEYIYKGKKFNSRKETVSDEKYLGLYIFRFYIKCPRCIAEIAFKTDPENTDYTLEAGATRNFEALKTAERLAMKEAVEKEEEEKNNPMKVLENRTKASLQEMDMFETLEELREMRSKHNTVDMATLLRMNETAAAERAKREEQEDEEYVKSIFGKDGVRYNKRLPDDDDSDSDGEDGASCSDSKRFKVPEKPSSILTAGLSSKPVPVVSKQKAALAGIIIRKKTVAKVTPQEDKEPSVTSAPLVTETNAPVVTESKAPPATESKAPVVTESKALPVTQSKPVGLAGLAAYSSSSDDNDSDN